MNDTLDQLRADRDAKWDAYRALLNTAHPVYRRANEAHALRLAHSAAQYATWLVDRAVFWAEIEENDKQKIALFDRLGEVNVHA